MVEYLLDNQPQTLDSGLKTWGDLLDRLDDACAVDRRTVTAVRFNGVDQPSFRGPEVEACLLPSIGRIEVETVDRTRLLRNTLGAAGNSLPTLAAGACRTASAFRGRDLTSAHLQLTSLIEAVRTLTMLTIASATAAGAELEDLSCGVNTGADVLGGVGIALDSLAQWQQGRDWIAVADALEYDLAPAILNWGVVFDAMHERCAA